MLILFCWLCVRNQFALEGHHDQFHQKYWGLSLPKHLHPVHWKCLLHRDIPFWSTEHFPSTNVPYWSICLIKVNSLAAKTANLVWSSKNVSDNLQISSNTCYLASSNLLWKISIPLGGIRKFCSMGYLRLGGIRTFRAQKVTQEILENFIKILNYISLHE